MANYYAVTRTNYFRVTNPEKLKEIVEHIVCSDGQVELFTRQSGSDVYYGFGCYGSIAGLYDDFENNVDSDSGYPDFGILASELQKIIADDDAIIITEIGYEKLRYLTAFASIITKHGCKVVGLDDVALGTARGLLNNPIWDTVSAY